MVAPHIRDVHPGQLSSSLFPLFGAISTFWRNPHIDTALVLLCQYLSSVPLQTPLLPLSASDQAAGFCVSSRAVGRGRTVSASTTQLHTLLSALPSPTATSYSFHICVMSQTPILSGLGTALKATVPVFYYLGLHPLDASAP